MSKKVFVTGLGIISAIGDNLEESTRSLQESRSGIGQINHLNTRYNHFPTGEVKRTDQELKEMIGITDNQFYTRTALLGMLAAKEAFYNAKLEHVGNKRIGLVSASTVGGMDKTELYCKEFFSSEEKNPHLAAIDTHDLGDSTEKIAALLGIKEYLTTISTACSSSANAIMHGARLIKNDMLDCVVVGGTDALSKFTMNGFNVLKILDEQHCKPFDEQRKGLNLGEGAGYLVLESEESVKTTGNKPLCELNGYANANDAFHDTGSSPDGDGAYKSIKKALEIAGLKPEDINYINVHGTGTENNDLSEGRAMARVFDDVPDFSSTKTYTGHTLGAAGGIEAVFSVLSILNQEIPALLNFNEQMKELDFKPVTIRKTGKQINHVMSNSFGFGGNGTVLIFGKS